MEDVKYISLRDNINDDLQRERNKCDFNVEELTNYWDGGAKLTKKRRDFEEKVYSIKGIKDEALEEYLSHKDRYENAIRKAVLLYEALKDLHDPNQTDKDKYREGFRNQVMAGVFKDNSPFGLHTAMFIPTLVSQADDEQKEKWLKRAYKYEILGTYAQTEMGHGTFIRGLETTATYDQQTEEFVLHSPTLTSHKWWPGNLAQTVNYAVVMAQLYIKGKNHGIQPFIVQLRDEETHMPLPGIKIGEIGPKLGYNTVNNGFLGFNQYRIPRRQMLMKNAQVLKDGTFKASSNMKLVYGTMVFVRVLIVNDSSNKLSRAVTIAVRYSAVRKQSKPKPNEPEPQVLDYATQQHKLFICIATCHAYWTTVRWLWDLYTDVTTDMNAGKLDRLPELHSLACCLKVVSSADCAGMIERCRLACGGHGYLASSNLPQLYGIATAACSYEGENTVLLLQTARSLAKAWNQASKGETLAPTMEYISDRTPLKQWDSSVDGIIKASQKVAAGKLSTSMASLESYRKSGMSSEDAWNKASVQLVAAAEAHGRSVVLSVFSSEMKRSTSSLSAPLQRVLNQLVEMYACYWTLEKLGDFALYTPITQQDVQFIQRKYEDLLEAVRPNAVGLVDAFDYRDELLNSTLGSYDGRVYERLMEEALKSPLNKEPVNQSFHKYLKPFMQKAKI